MTRKLSALQTLMIHLSQSSSHALYWHMAAAAGRIAPAGHAEQPVSMLAISQATQAESEAFAAAEALAHRRETAGIDLEQGKQRDRHLDSDATYPARLHKLTLTLNAILINAADKEALIPAFAVITAEIRAARRQEEGRKTPLRVWGGLAAIKGGGRAPRLLEIAQDWKIENRNAPLLEFLQLAFTAAYFARNRFQEDSNAHALSPSVLRPLTGPDSAFPTGPQPPALPGSPSTPASESTLPWQASAPPDEADSRQPNAGRRPRLRRHSVQPEQPYERREEGYAASAQGPAASPPPASEPTGTDVRALRTYSALIQQTREEDRAELEALGGQIQAARAALGVSRKQLVTLLHLDLELLVALEHGCGDVATARLVLEQVSAIVERRRRVVTVQ